MGTILSCVVRETDKRVGTCIKLVLIAFEYSLKSLLLNTIFGSSRADFAISHALIGLFFIIIFQIWYLSKTEIYGS